MEEKELLTEENYQKSKKKVMRIALIIFMLGLLIGGGLIITGLIKTKEIKKQNDLITQQIEQNNETRTATDIQNDIDKTQTQIDEIDKKIDNLEAEKSKLRTEQSRIFVDDRGFSDRYYAKEDEINAKQNEINDLEKEKSKLNSSLSDYKTELWKVNSGYNDSKKHIEEARNTISTRKYIPLYMFGGFIIIASSMIALFFYTAGKGREIAAFTTQQAMPIAQEEMGKITPTVGNMAETISEGVAKGIKSGIKDVDDEKEN